MLDHFRMILNYKKIKKSFKPQAPSFKQLDTILVIGYYRIRKRGHMKLNKKQMDQAIEMLRKTIPGAKTEKRKDMENIVKFFVKLNEFCDKNKYTLTENHWKYLNKRLKEDEKN